MYNSNNIGNRFEMHDAFYFLHNFYTNNILSISSLSQYFFVCKSVRNVTGLCLFIQRSLHFPSQNELASKFRRLHSFSFLVSWIALNIIFLLINFVSDKEKSRWCNLSVFRSRIIRKGLFSVTGIYCNMKYIKT